MSPTGYPDYPTSLLCPPRFTAFKPPSEPHHENGWFLEVVRTTMLMRAGDAKVATMLVMLLSASLAGCLGGDASDKEDGPISMNVYYEATSGTITDASKTALCCLQRALNCPLISHGSPQRLER